MCEHVHLLFDRKYQHMSAREDTVIKDIMSRLEEAENNLKNEYMLDKLFYGVCRFSAGAMVVRRRERTIVGE